MQGIVTGACWVLVVAIWIVGAVRLNHASARRQPLGSGAIWRIGAVIVAVLIVGAAGTGLKHFTTHSWWLEGPGLVLLVASTVFTLWARFSLGAMWSLSPNVLRNEHQLRTSGPYGVTRHPIYTGLLGMLLGTALLNGVGVLISLPVVGIAAFATRVSIEERLMVQAFPDDYRRYRERVPQLIPGLRLGKRPR
jgi:protein-S-isoprenylcysteine O-methyltransferase Ste14